MKRQIAKAVFVGLALFVGISVYRIWDPFQPQYHGRKIGEWLKNYPKYKLNDRAEAEAAIAHFGTNGIRYIFAEMRQERFQRLKMKLWENGPNWLSRRVGLPTPGFGPEYAPEIFEIIGPASIPYLREALADDSQLIRTAAVLGLDWFGPRSHYALPELTKLLDDPTSDERLWQLTSKAIKRINSENEALSRVNRN